MAKTKETNSKYFFVPELKITQVDKIEWDSVPRVYDSKSAANAFSYYIAEKDLANQINVNEFAFVIYLNKRNKILGITNHTIGA